MPSRASRGWLTVATQLSSDIPQTSAMGMPIPAKKASVSLGIGAAPDMAHRSSAKPSRSRSLDNTNSSARAHSAATSSGIGSPESSAPARFAATPSAHCNACRFTSSGS